MTKKFNIDFVYAIFLLILLIILKYHVLNLPYFWDGLNYMIPTIDYLYKNPITIFLWEYNLGHPPFFFILIGVLFKIFTDSSIVAHSTVLLFSFLTLFFTYLIGKELFNRKIGVIASLLLLFTPIFFSYSSLLFLAIPLAAFTVMALYFAIKSKPLLYFIFGSLAVLTETTGILLILGIIIGKFIQGKNFKKTLIYFLPILTFITWIISNKIYYNEFLDPVATSLIQINIIKNFFNFLIILKSIFFDQYRWILTSIFLFSFINFKNLKNKKNLFSYLIIAILLFILFYNVNVLSKYLINYYANVDNYLTLFKNFSMLFSILFLIIILYYKDILNFFKNSKYIVLIISFLIVILAHVFIIPFSPRYVLFAYPIFFLFYAFSIIKVFKKDSYFITILLIILFSLNFTGSRDVVGFVLEDNMEYVDMVKTHQLAAAYIETNFPNATVLAAYPQSLELQYACGKYVNKQIKVITVPPFPGVTEYIKDYKKFLTSKYKNEINLSEIDLYYYSKQEYPTKDIIDAKNHLNLTLIKRFEINNKSTEIYLVSK